MTRRVAAPKAGRLFQEDLLENPFWMLVACSLVNLTTWDQARPAFEWIRSAYPEVSDLAKADPEDLHEALRPLGLWRLRAARLPLMAQCWELFPPASASEVPSFPGCGRYAGDSWAIFVEGRLDVEPDDGKLNWYLERMKLHTTNQPKETDMSAKPEPKTADLLADYNRLAKEHKLPTLGYWKGSKVALTAKIDTLKAAKAEVVKMPTKAPKPKAEKPEPKAKAVKLPPEKIKAEVADAIAAPKSDRPLMSIATDEEVDAEVAAMPEVSGASIKEVACQLLTAVRCIDPFDDRKVGYSYLAILKRLAQLFPGSSTSNACLRWYLVRVRQDIEGFDKHKMPIRFKRPKSKM